MGAMSYTIKWLPLKGMASIKRNLHPLKTLQTFGFLMFSFDAEMLYWLEIG